MVAAHLQSVLAGVLNVVAEVRRGVGGAFGGFDIDKADFLVAAHGVPINILLVARHVDSVIVGAFATALHLHLLGFAT